MSRRHHGSVPRSSSLFHLGGVAAVLTAVLALAVVTGAPLVVVALVDLAVAALVVTSVHQGVLDVID